MSSQPCSSRDILDINKSKEYTLISTTLLENVLTDTRLNAQSVKLWQLLFNQARYSPNLDIKISYSYLSKRLGKSTRTISRYVETLQNTGYLIVTHNFDKNGGQRPSTISVRVPKFSIEYAKDKKDRQHKNCLANNDLLIEPFGNGVNNNNNLESNAHELAVPIKDLIKSPVNNIVLRETVQDNSRVLKKNQMKPQTTPVETQDVQKMQDLVMAPQDKNDGGRYDTNVIQKDINKKDINNNNSVVAVSPIDLKNSPLNELENEINCLEKRISEGTKVLNDIKSHTERYNQIRKNAELEGSLHVARIALERLNNKINNNKSELQMTDTLTRDSLFMANRAGDRTISSFTFKRLTSSLKQYGYQGNNLNSLINEIIFEVRFGSLVQCNINKQSLDIDKAINISLKLLRENRWSTPTLLKKSVAADFYNNNK